MQLNYLLANQRLASERRLPLAADPGTAVLINRPFGGGAVVSRDRDVPLPDWSAEFDATSWAPFLLEYALSQPAAAAAIPGTTEDRHVEDDMPAATARTPSHELGRRQASFLDSP